MDKYTFIPLSLSLSIYIYVYIKSNIYILSLYIYILLDRLERTIFAQQNIHIQLSKLILMCIYIYIYIHIYICTCTHVHMYIQTSITFSKQILSIPISLFYIRVSICFVCFSHVQQVAETATSVTPFGQASSTAWNTACFWERTQISQQIANWSDCSTRVAERM